jgi:hypothetical protein
VHATHGVTRERPESLRDKSPRQPSLVPHTESSSLASLLQLLGVRLEVLVPLLLVVGHHLNDEDGDEEDREGVVGDVEGGDLERGRVGGSEREEEVHGELGRGEEHVLHDGDEEEVHCGCGRQQRSREETDGRTELELPDRDTSTNDLPTVVLRRAIPTRQYQSMGSTSRDSRVEESTTVSVGRQPRTPEELQAHHEQHPLVELSRAAPLGPHGKMHRVDHGQDGPETIDLRDVA